MDYRDVPYIILCLLIILIFGVIKMVINRKNKNGNYKFNAKQSVAFWTMGILISLLILFNIFLGAKEYYALKMGPITGEQYIKIVNLEDSLIYYKTTFIKRNWDFVLAGSIIILIIGSLFIHALRDKKNSIHQ